MPLSYGKILREAEIRLKQAGMDTPELDARVLSTAAFGISRTELFLKADEFAPEDGISVLKEFIRRRLAHEPVGRILGVREFWGLPFHLSPDTLEPRPDSETLVEAVLEVRSKRDAPLRILDLGTGTGCLLLALLHEYPNALGTGVDASAGAVNTARQNAENLGFSGRSTFVLADWNNPDFADLFPWLFDVIVSNPPYISSSEMNGLQPEVRLHDPVAALDGGSDGLAVYRRIAEILPNLLESGGEAVFEVGQGQAGAVQKIFQGAGLTETCFRSDLTGIMRCVTVTKR